MPHYDKSDKRYPSYFHNYEAFGNKSMSLNTTPHDKHKEIKDNYDTIMEMFNEGKYYDIIDMLYNCSTDDDTHNKRQISKELFSYCLKNDDMNIFDILLKNDVFSQDTNLMLECIANNNIKMFKIILDNVTFTQTDYYEFSEWAIDYGKNIIVLDMLREVGYVIHNNLIMRAILEDYTDLLLYFISCGYDIQTIYDSWKYSMNIYFNTIKILHTHIDMSKHIELIFSSASIRGDMNSIMFIVDNYPNIHIDTCLLWGCTCSRVDVVKYSLQKGADVQIISELSILKTNIHIIKILLEHGYKLKSKILNVILIRYFVEGKDFDDIKYLIGLDANILCVIEDGKTYWKKEIYKSSYKHSWVKTNQLYYLYSPLETIVSMGHLDHIKFLVDNYYHLLEPYINKMFVVACANGRLDIAKYLYGFGVEINDKCMLSACYFGHLEIVKYLLELGKDVDSDLYDMVKDGYKKKDESYNKLIDGSDVFMNDAYHGGKEHIKILELLLKYGMIINNIDGDFNKDFYNVEIFKYVIQQVEDINKKYNKIIGSFTFLDLSVLCEKYDVVDLLLSHGAIPTLTGFISYGYKSLLLKYGYEI